MTNDYELLKRISFLLRLACKEADSSHLEQYELNLDDLDIFTMFNRPKGNGWNSFIAFVHKHFNDINLKNINIIVPIIHEWNSKERESDTTRLASLIALQYYKNEYKSEKIIQSILFGALKIENELIVVLDKVIREKDIDRQSLYYDLIKNILTDYSGISIYQKPFIQPLLQLCDLFWFKNYALDQSRDDFHNFNEKKYCVSDSHDFKYFPSHAYKTPIYWLLKVGMSETIDFILEFANKIVECSFEKNKNDFTIEVELEIDGQIRKQYHNIEYWAAYRGRGNTPYLFKSIHMALELFLLEQAKILDEYHLEILLKHLLLNSKSSSVSAIIGSIVLAYPEKTFNIALILFGVKEFIIYDNSRTVNEHIDFDIFPSLNNDILHEIAMKQTNDYTHRKKNLESLFRDYQFFSYGDIGDEEFTKRQEKLWSLLDKYNTNLDEKDTSWRFCLGRIDRRGMKPTVEEHGEGQIISFNPKMDDDLIEKSKATSKRIDESVKYLPLQQWLRYKYDNDNKLKEEEYIKYENDHNLVIAKIKEIMGFSEEDKNSYHIYRNELACYGSCVLMRDYSGELSQEDKIFCKDILIKIALEDMGSSSGDMALNFLPYMIKEFDDISIKMILFDLLFKGYKLNLDLWNKSYDDALSLLIGYLILRPKYLQLLKKKRSEFDKKNRYLNFDAEELLSLFIGENETLIADIMSNTIAIDLINDYGNIDISTLMKAFEFIPYEGTEDKLKDISKNIISTVSSELLLDDKDKFDFQKVDSFLSKMSYIILNLDQKEIKEYLAPFLDSFSGNEIFSKLFTELIIAEDGLQKYDNFWYIWGLFEDKIIELCKKGDAYWYIDNIIYSYLLAKNSHNSNIWKKDSKSWHTLKEKDIKYLKKVTENISHCPSVLYAVSKLLMDIGSDFLNVGISWLSNLLKNDKLQSTELKDDTIFNIEILIRKYILQNSEKIRKEKIKKEEVLVVLNFLVEHGSAIGYMLRERVL